MLRVHSNQACEFHSLSWNAWCSTISKQTFTSTRDPSANGVAKRWVDQVKVKIIFVCFSISSYGVWCYAVPWVACTYNHKVWGQNPKKSLPEFRKMLLLRTKRQNNFQGRAELVIMMGFNPQIPHGVVALVIQANKTITFFLKNHEKKHTHTNSQLLRL